MECNNIDILAVNDIAKIMKVEYPLILAHMHH